MDVILYSTDCPKCKVIKKKLDNANINYCIINDIDKMTELGINEVPVVSVNGEMMNFVDANKWINNVMVGVN